MKRGNSDIGKRFRHYATNQKLYRNPIYKSEYWQPVNTETPVTSPITPLKKRVAGLVRSKMSIERMRRGMTGLVFAKKLRDAGLQAMTESKVFRIETGRAVVTDQERNAIVQLLGSGLFEIRRNYLGRLEYKIQMCEEGTHV
jgi:hypothetical protein